MNTLKITAQGGGNKKSFACLRRNFLETCPKNWRTFNPSSPFNISLSPSFSPLGCIGDVKVLLPSGTSVVLGMIMFLPTNSNAAHEISATARQNHLNWVKFSLSQYKWLKKDERDPNAAQNALNILHRTRSATLVVSSARSAEWFTYIAL